MSFTRLCDLGQTLHLALLTPQQGDDIEDSLEPNEVNSELDHIQHTIDTLIPEIEPLMMDANWT